ncbi:MAG: hypothetical protein RR998_09160 [Oscillospiraceae bacterium]
MKKLVSFVAGMAAVGAGVAAAAYYFQKKGIVNVEVTYENDLGETVTRPLDELVDRKAAELADRAIVSASELAHSVKVSLDEQLECVNRQLRKGCERTLAAVGVVREVPVDLEFGETDYE